MAAAARVVIYGTPHCSYCIAARSLLTGKGVDFEDIIVSNDDGSRRELALRSGRNTVPQIFVDDEPLGGFDELIALDQNRLLDALLGQA